MDGSWCNCVLVLEEVGSKVVLQRTATGPGAQLESLSDIQRHVRRVDNDLRAQVDQYSIETGVMEDVVSTVHFGLVEVGGFVRHKELRDNKEPQCWCKKEPIL